MQEQDFKTICGQLIGFYRISYYEKTKSYKYTQRGMISKADRRQEPAAQKSLCSTTTLRQLEKGQAKRNDNLYCMLARKINRSYLYSRKYLNTIQILIEDVYQNIEKMNRPEMFNLLKRIENHALNSYLYYAEILQILSSLLLFYLEQQLPNEATVLWYCQIAPLMPKTVRRMAVHISAEYYRRIDYHPEKIHELIDEHLLEKKDFLYFYTMIPCLITIQRFLKARSLLEQLKNSLDFANNPYKQFYYHNMLACILTNIDFEAADKALDTCVSLVQNPLHFNTCQQATIYHNIGLRYLFKQHYQTAAEYLIMASRFNPRIIPAMLPYLYQACQNSLYKDQPVLQALALYRKIKIKPMGLFSHYIKYFIRRCSGLDRQTAKELESKIIEDILPALRISSQKVYYSSYLREFFIDELRKLNQLSHSQNIIEKI